MPPAPKCHETRLRSRQAKGLYSVLCFFGWVLFCFLAQISRPVFFDARFELPATRLGFFDGLAKISVSDAPGYFLARRFRWRRIWPCCGGDSRPGNLLRYMLFSWSETGSGSYPETDLRASGGSFYIGFFFRAHYGSNFSIFCFRLLELGAKARI